jgi:hypothetical protein
MSGAEDDKRTVDAAAGEGRAIRRFFVSYAHDDEAQSTTLVGKLEVLFRGHVQVSFKPWSDHQILPGTQWRGEIQKTMEACEYVVLMVSQAFVASEFIRNEELPYLLQNKRVIPVALKPTPEKIIPKEIGALQIFYDAKHRTFIDRTNDRTRDEFAMQLFDRICAIVDGQSEQESRNLAAVRRLGPDDARYFINCVYPLLESRIPESELRSEEDMVRFLGESGEKIRLSPGRPRGSCTRLRAEHPLTHLSLTWWLDAAPPMIGSWPDSCWKNCRTSCKAMPRMRVQPALCLKSKIRKNAKSPSERRERLARFRLFAGMAQARGFDLRLIQTPYYQPRIGVDPDVHEVPLALLIARPKSEQGWHEMPKARSRA